MNAVIQNRANALVCQDFRKVLGAIAHQHYLRRQNVADLGDLFDDKRAFFALFAVYEKMVRNRLRRIEPRQLEGHYVDVQRDHFGG